MTTRGGACHTTIQDTASPHLVILPNGDWWFSYNYEVLGRFPASVFTTLNKGACAAHVYGEVYNPNPQNGWVKTEMGSGQFSTGAPDNVAWARQIRYFDATWAFANEPQTDNSVYWSKPYATECYDRSPLTYQGSAGPIMLLGGPGGLDPVCAQKKPSP